MRKHTLAKATSQCNCILHSSISTCENRLWSTVFSSIGSHISSMRSSCTGKEWEPALLALTGTEWHIFAFCLCIWHLSHHFDPEQRAIEKSNRISRIRIDMDTAWNRPHVFLSVFHSLGSISSFSTFSFPFSLSLVFTLLSRTLLVVDILQNLSWMMVISDLWKEFSYWKASHSLSIPTWRPILPSQHLLPFWCRKTQANPILRS